MFHKNLLMIYHLDDKQNALKIVYLLVNTNNFVFWYY